MSSHSKHILTIRLSAMGDVAIAVPVICTLLKTHSNLKVTVLTKPQFKVLFDFLPQVHVVCAEVKTKHKGLGGLYQLSRELKTLNLTEVADLHNVIRSKVLKFFLRLQGIKVKTINKGRTEKKALTRTNRKVFKPLKPTINRYADVFRNIGIALDMNQPECLPKQELKSSIKSDLEFDPSKTYLGIAPFAAHDGKVYPADLMQEVIKKLSQNKSLNIYLFGGGKLEMSRLHNWEKPYKNVYCIAGRYDFKTELCLISNLDAMLSMDSGNGHLAAMFAVKVFTIWGQTHPHAGFAPLGQTKDQQFLPDRSIFPLLPTSIYGNKEVEGYQNVMRTIDPNDVADKISKQLFPKNH
ncbi:glycosyltransferase family 9 protein [Mesohalobacter halotolerans]|uniref:Glycosyltransferase family 9 protein n=1 Tax=Mesohalobacter halotolerans TaxID=1883405 RepID=A0A4U5TU09_9FLAO|nr:glycosyltransferase family 9 protein [Mesohalobacter halotolerans]MBS3737711.1 glycosyltransferase family 9 protein [Psychroflexus sp.]TKS57391.1 glycosyltransferase family 9 protein [Mesohalobacter halotolerans]